MNKYWHTKKGFRNPEEAPDDKVTIWSGIRYAWSRITKSPFKVGVNVPEGHVVSKKEYLNGLEQHKRGEPVITWLGHCAFLITGAGTTILTDPFLTGSSGGVITRSLRRIPLPASLAELPDVDVLLISHSHYDHLHIPSVKKLSKTVSIKSAIAPLRVGKRLKKYSIPAISELDWFENKKVNNIEFTALPAAHYSTVIPFKNTELWASYKIAFSVNSSTFSLYFSGDSGYGSFFKRDIAPYGPFNLSLFGIINYVASAVVQARNVHTSMDQAFRATKDINAHNMIGMHWGTSHMMDEGAKDIPDRLKQTAIDASFPGTAKTMRIGETLPLITFAK